MYKTFQANTKPIPQLTALLDSAWHVLWGIRTCQLLKRFWKAASTQTYGLKRFVDKVNYLPFKISLFISDKRTINNNPTINYIQNVTPLMVAAADNELPIASALIRHGADVNLQDDLGILFCSANWDLYPVILNAPLRWDRPHEGR